MTTKSIVSVIAAFVLAAFSFKFASANSGTNESEKTASIKTAMENVKYPEFAIKENLKGEVVISFNVTENGKIIVNQSNGTYPELVKYIEQELQKIELDSSSFEVGKIYFYCFKFKLI